MNIQFLRNLLLLIIILIRFQLSAAFGQATNSNYSGANSGIWGDPMNWTPAGVPNNSGTATFNVTIDNKAVTLDIDTTISSLTTPGNAPHLTSNDHSLTSAATDTVAGGTVEGGGSILFAARNVDVKFDLGNYAAFSGTTLNETAAFFDIRAAAGRTATLQFNGAHIVNNNAGIFLGGAGAAGGTGTVKIVDENGADALRDFSHNLLHGFIQVSEGATYTFPNSIVNEGDASSCL